MEQGIDCVSATPSTSRGKRQLPGKSITHSYASSSATPATSAVISGSLSVFSVISVVNLDQS